MGVRILCRRAGVWSGTKVNLERRELFDVVAHGEVTGAIDPDAAASLKEGLDETLTVVRPAKGSVPI